jgi:hypothetical protein
VGSGDWVASSENEPSLGLRTDREHHDCSVFFLLRSSFTSCSSCTWEALDRRSVAQRRTHHRAKIAELSK